jgi:hypothetical protein
MTDRQIIETLKNIKEYCLKRQCGERCIFYAKNQNICQIKELFGELYKTPDWWNFSEIKEILSE